MTFVDSPSMRPPQEKVDVDCLEDKLGLWLRIAQRRFTENVNRNFARHKANQLDFMLLDLLERNAGCRLMSLAPHLQLKPPNLAKAVDDLVAREMITKVPDPVDRRANRLYITEYGARFLSELRHDYGVAHDQICQAIEPAAADELLRLLRRLAQAPVGRRDPMRRSDIY